MATDIVWPFIRVKDMSDEEAPEATQEELDILELLAQGYTDEVVARRLGLARRTYRRRLRSVMDRLGARSRFQVGVLAVRRGWIRNASGSIGHNADEEPVAPRHTHDTRNKEGASNG